MTLLLFLLLIPIVVFLFYLYVYRDIPDDRIEHDEFKDRE